MDYFSEQEVLDIIRDFMKFAGFRESDPLLNPAVIRKFLEERGNKRVERKGKTFQLWTDGASRGNPGIAGTGVVIAGEDSRVRIECGKCLGIATNNEAEYRALILGLEEVLPFNPQHLIIYSDSELLVNQIRGTYKTRSPALRELHVGVLNYLSKIDTWEIQHISRTRNSVADGLANKAIEAHALEKKYWLFQTG